MLFLSLRHLSSRKLQTTLMILGITLGSAAYVVISGMMLGFREFIVDQLVNNDAHIRISLRDEPITPEGIRQQLFDTDQPVAWLSPPTGRRDRLTLEHPQGWIERLEADPNVLAYSPQLQIQGLGRKGSFTQNLRIIGSDPSKQERVTTIANYMVQGDFKDIARGGSRVIVGTGMLEKLGAKVGDTMRISSGISESLPYQIVGSFRFGIRSLDDTTAFVSLIDAQKLFRQSGAISDIAIRLHDLEKTRPLAEDWQRLSTDKVQSWEQANEGTLSVFKTQDIVRLSMTISIVIVAGFGIYNILSMAVNTKKPEIAILRSVGFEPGDIVRLFLTQGLILGLLGGILGVALGYVACLWMSTIEVSSQRMMGGGRMMVSFNPEIYRFGFLMALGSSALASFLPARAAGKFTPIEIIRGGGA